MAARLLWRCFSHLGLAHDIWAAPDSATWLLSREVHMSDSTADQVTQIPETMQAVICHGPENYRWKRYPSRSRDRVRR